jgi:Fe-S cluster biogenesis protein NfuA
MEERELQRRVQQIEGLLCDLEAVGNPEVRAKAVELVRLLMNFHGAALERMMEGVAREGEAGERLFAAFARDPVVSGTLLLYGLHPLDVETRVRQALERVRPLLRSHGGDAELLGVEGGRVRLRLEGSCKGCPSSSVKLRLAIEEAVYEAAPDVVAVEAEGAAEQSAPPGLVQIGRAQTKAAPQVNAALTT